MATKNPSYIYKETRLNLDSAISGSTVIIRLPTHGSLLSRNAPKRPHIAEPAPAEDENAFKLRYLATAGSVYHRRLHNSPKSFLWRTLEDNKVLAIRAVDLCKKETAPDANITLRLQFPSPIRPSCIAFAESKHHDVLLVYAMTASGHLYVLTLRPDFFRRPGSTEDNVGDWCKSYVAAGPLWKTAHRLVAMKADELLVALSGGGLLGLGRKQDEDVWRETHYNESNMIGKITSSFSFRNTNTHRVGNINFDRTSVVSLTPTPTTIFGSPYVFTVCLDHQLRVWNLVTAKLAYSGDILTQSRLASDMTKYTIDASASQLVRVFENSIGITVVTYSPIGVGQFKFWAVQPGEGGSLYLTDKFPGHVFDLKAPSSDQWTLLDFAVVVGSEPKTTDLWVLWKNNLSLRVHKVELDLTEATADLQKNWNNDWMAMATETLEESPLPMILPSDPSDSTDKWLEHIFFPGRFSSATIETALNIYENSLGRAKNASARRSRRVAERMCSLVASTASLTPSSESPNYQQFRLATDTQWRRFYRLLVELERSRGEALSLSIDSELGLPWVTTADGISIIRACSTLENIWHNSDEPRHMSGQKQLASLINAAAVFRDGCPDSLIHSCNAVLTAELAQDPLLTDHMRMRSFYEKTNFAGQIGDEEYAQLLTNLGGTFGIMNDDSVYNDLFGIMADLVFPNKQESHPLTDFGKKAVVKGVQETIELHRTICFDQLMLLVFFENEVDQKEEGTRLDTAWHFRELITMLSRLELVKWLAKTQITIRHPRSSPRSELARDKSSSASKRSSVEEHHTVTVLEGCSFHLLGFDIANLGQNLPSMFTDLLMQICDSKSEFELEPYLIQCYLLKHHRVDLALEFNRFCLEDPFSTYIQGRAYLAANELETASMFFKRAAFGISLTGGQGLGRVSTHSLLDETEWNLLFNGLPMYYAHIVSLFDKEKFYSYVADFANLSLQLNPFPTQPDLLNLRTEILSRLFNAYIQTSRFELAHSTLTLFTDHALQLNSLRTLVLKMCETSHASLLIALPFLGLQDSVDEILHSKCALVIDVNVGVPYHKILYAWRIKRNNFRGAAAILLERLQRLKGTRDGDRREGDGGETQVTKGYLMLINALSCVDPKQAWVLEEGEGKGRRNSGGGREEKRVVRTLKDLRGEYGGELDRIAAIENDQFGFMEVDEDGDVMDLE